MAKPVSPRGLARDRVLHAALELFAEHGVHGTTLKMIADRIGVSKPALYNQFRSKDVIVMEVIAPVLADMSRVAKIAEALPEWEARRAVTISGLVEMAVRHRRLAALSHDPAIASLMLTKPEMQAVGDTIRELLEGPAPDAAVRIAFSMLFAGMGHTVTDPLLTDIPDEDLHRVLLMLWDRAVSGLGEATPADGGGQTDRSNRVLRT